MADDKAAQQFQLYKLLKEKAVRQARDDCPVFLKYVFEYQFAQMHYEWHQFMDTNTRGIMLAHRGSGKSEQATIGRVLWEVGRDPNIRIKIVTETDDRAGDLLSRISAIIQQDDKFKDVFPDCIPANVGSWTKFKVTVKRTEHHVDPTIAASGILTSSTGGRADLIIFDDIAGYRNTLAYPRLRGQVKEAFHSNWLPMMAHDPKRQSRWWLVGTPWHIDDIVSELRNNVTIPHAKEYWVGDNFESPWPERYSSEFFKTKLTESPTRRHYNRSFRGIALSDEESWVDAAAVDASRDFSLSPRQVLENKEIVKYVGVDLGHRGGKDTCPTVIFVLGRMPNGKRVPVVINILRRNEPLETARAIIRVWQEIRPAKIFVENNGAQKYLIDIIKGLVPDLGMPLEGYYTGQQKLSPEVGVPSLLAELETGQWTIPMGGSGSHDNACQCNFCFWIRELKDYPNSSDNTLMASWLALEALRKIAERQGGGFSVWKWGT